MARDPDDVELETADWTMSEITLIPVSLPDETTSSEARGFMVAAITVALLAFDLAFDLAVWGDLFFRNYMTIWVVALAILLASAALPERRRPLGCGGMAVLALPSLYFPAAVVTTWVHATPMQDTVVALLGMFIVVLVSGLLALSTLISLPFVMLTLARVLDPSIISVPTVKMRVALALLALIMAVAGGGLGLAHPYWLTCEDFAIAGNAAPADCTPVAPGWR